MSCPLTCCSCQNFFVQGSPQPWLNTDILVSGLRHILNVTNNKIYREGNFFNTIAQYFKMKKKYNFYISMKSGVETRF
jgi:hypothetical protein